MHLELKRLWRQGEVAGAHSGGRTGGPVSLVQEVGNGNESGEIASGGFNVDESHGQMCLGRELCKMEIGLGQW